MKDMTSTGVVRFGDRKRWDKPWDDLRPEAGCALDFIASTALIEWLSQQGLLNIPAEQESQLSQYREYGQLVGWDVVAPQLVLFENVFLSIGTFYQHGVDLSPLNDLGFFQEFPRPHREEFLPMYQLLSPVMKYSLAQHLERIAGKSFDEIWTKRGRDAELEFGDYEGLAEWLFMEFSKDVCGLPPNEGQLISRLLPGLAYQFFDFVEYASSGQGHFVDAPIPYLSSMLKPHTSATIPRDRLPHREDSFALYQIAASEAIGFRPVINSFDDVLRLREDKGIEKIRSLLGLYRGAANRNEDEVINEVTQEIIAARKAIKRFDFTESLTYTYGATALGLVPVVGSVVSVLTGSVQLMKDLAKRKHGWIYFGVK